MQPKNKSDGYTHEEAQALVGRQVSKANTNGPARLGDVIAHDIVESVPGQQENCVWVQWDGADEAVLFGKLNEGQDFKVDRSMDQKQSTAKDIHPSRMPASRTQVDVYKELLSKPDTSMEPTPMGNVTGDFDSQKNRSIMASIRSTESKLADRMDQARSNFNHASENSLSNIFHNARGMHM